MCTLFTTQYLWGKNDSLMMILCCNLWVSYFIMSCTNQNFMRNINAPFYNGHFAVKIVMAIAKR